ncbi:MAG TPA: TspO/MBR family protein [Chitinophagaceae bacterium]|nr:TspO/MBR family protein [Chitinophagaceae bacterium]
MNKVLKLIIAIAIPLAVAAVSGLITSSNINNWYTFLNKPSWNPPNWVFGPVWTTLYIMMGIAFYLIWKSDDSNKEKRISITLFFIQLVLNFFWSIIFFYYHHLLGAFIEIIFLWTTILLTIFSFAKVSKLAAWLLVPYISWVSFATILTYTVWQLNK